MTDAMYRSSGDGQFTDNRMIMVIRHAEKPLHPSGSPHGVNPDGREDPHSLTVTGWIRAGALVELFAPTRGDPPAELRRPDTIYASAYAGGHSKRSMQTVTPLAARLGLQVVKRYAAGDEGQAIIAGVDDSPPGVAEPRIEAENADAAAVPVHPSRAITSSDIS